MNRDGLKLPNHIAGWLAYRDLSQADAARWLGVNKSTVGRWVSGETIPSGDYGNRLAGLLRVERFGHLLFPPPDKGGSHGSGSET